MFMFKCGLRNSMILKHRWLKRVKFNVGANYIKCRLTDFKLKGFNHGGMIVSYLLTKFKFNNSN